jgi:hypothetical protein
MKAMTMHLVDMLAWNSQYFAALKLGNAYRLRYKRYQAALPPETVYVAAGSFG